MTGFLLLKKVSPYGAYIWISHYDTLMTGDMKMNILVIDAQGGGIGRMLVSEIRKEFPGSKITAVGTNSIATASMLKAGANYGATGENPVVVTSADADVIIGPIGIIMADAMIGEITPLIASSIARSKATKILIPFNNCHTYIAGVDEQSTGDLILSAIEKLRQVNYDKNRCI